ncbi:DUF5658 family protein [Metallosphaera hakonensis]|uniref:Uncharacterized protein n=1 Tax=Metallosphaera hakonensis JCM 8857 = DSM 7519 TaxID=1293036 RepID=A0A2U9ITJ1_9CREN|nr:DUF5658 family protein [Metallosphaera hakonensis]AWR99371.1 hypothetical protein DFR87_06250 [Metallosphaera hakonensis JCM 8857 = DSM 7519]
MNSRWLWVTLVLLNALDLFFSSVGWLNFYGEGNPILAPLYQGMPFPFLLLGTTDVKVLTLVGAYWFKRYVERWEPKAGNLLLFLLNLGYLLVIVNDLLALFSSGWSL